MCTKDMRKVFEAAKALGFTAERTNKGHWKFELAGKVTVFFSGTPGDRRAIQNGISKLRRAARGVN